VTAEPRPPDENHEVVEAETQPANDKIAETGAQPTDMSAETPTWSLEAARERAKKLRSILDQGEDPASYQKQNTVAPVESVIRFIAEHLRTEP
jgi:hypothetical protein